MIEKFFTTEQVANILQVHPFTILKFIKAGKLKGIKLGRVYRIKESDVQEFLESRSTGVRAGASRSDAEAAKIEKKPVEQTKTDSKPHFDIEKKDDDQHYYII